MLYTYLQERGMETVWYREPGDSPWGRKIRELADREDSIPIEEELEYFIKDREWNVNTNILPGLKENKIVILDRYYFSTACYQGARGFDVEEIISRNTRFAPIPDITLIVDVDVTTALERIRGNREGEAILFEKRDFLEKVRNNYHNLEGDNLYFVDGTQPLESVFSNVWNHIEPFLKA